MTNNNNRLGDKGFSELVTRTSIFKEGVRSQEFLTPDERYALGDLQYATDGLASEVGEVKDHVKKIVRNDGSKITAERRAGLLDELSDVLWYLEASAQALGLTVADLRNYNYVKITRREEDGTIKERPRQTHRFVRVLLRRPGAEPELVAAFQSRHNDTELSVSPSVIRHGKILKIVSAGNSVDVFVEEGRG